MRVPLAQELFQPAWFAGLVGSPALAEKQVTGPPPGEGPAVQRLSDRELEVFRLLGRGRATRQIADELHLSPKTVQAFCARIKDKLGLSSSTELLREAIRWAERPDGQ